MGCTAPVTAEKWLSSVWDKTVDGSILLFWRYLNSITTQAYAEKLLDLFSHFDTIPA